MKDEDDGYVGERTNDMIVRLNATVRDLKLHEKEIRNALGDHGDSPASTLVLAQNLLADRNALQEKVREYERVNRSVRIDVAKMIKNWTRLQMRMPGFMGLETWLSLADGDREIIQRTVDGKRPDIYLSPETIAYRESQFPTPEHAHVYNQDGLCECGTWRVE